MKKSKWNFINQTTKSSCKEVGIQTKKFCQKLGNEKLLFIMGFEPN